MSASALNLPKKVRVMMGSMFLACCGEHPNDQSARFPVRNVTWRELRVDIVESANKAGHGPRQSLLADPPPGFVYGSFQCSLPAGLSREYGILAKHIHQARSLKRFHDPGFNTCQHDPVS